MFFFAASWSLDLIENQNLIEIDELLITSCSNRDPRAPPASVTSPAFVDSYGAAAGTRHPSLPPVRNLYLDRKCYF